MQKQVKAAVIEGPAAQTSIPIAAKQGKTAAAIQNLT